MEFRLQITSRQFSLSEGLEMDIYEKASKLERICDRLTGVRVVVDTERRGRRRGTLYTAQVDLSVPGVSLSVCESDEEVHAAIRKVFEAALRRLEDHLRRRRGDRRARKMIQADAGVPGVT